MKVIIDVTKIQRARLEKGYTQGELAKRSGLTFTSINYMERKRTVPRPYNLKRICDVLDLSISDVCAISDDFNI